MAIGLAFAGNLTEKDERDSGYEPASRSKLNQAITMNESEITAIPSEQDVNYTPADFRRFWSKFTIAEGCWEWTGCKDRKGYGQFCFMGKHQRAHRVSYMIFKSYIPAGLLVCHDCDNPGCVNPKHLLLGTPADNSGHMVLRNRQALGNKNGTRTFPESIPWGERRSGKLTNAQAQEIRILAAERKTSQRVIAALFNVHQSIISRILNRRTWQRLP